MDLHVEPRLGTAGHGSLRSRKPPAGLASRQLEQQDIFPLPPTGHVNMPAPSVARRIALAASLSLCACTATVRHGPEFIAPSAGPARPLSAAVRANGFLFLAGQLG